MFVSISKSAFRQHMEELQKSWKIPSIAQFVSLFRNAFALPEMDIEELEESFVAYGTPQDRGLLQTVFISLLRVCCRKKDIGVNDWEAHLYKFLQKKWAQLGQRRNPVSLNQPFGQLELHNQIDILYSLCLYRLDCNDVEATMKAMDASALRVQSLGCDNSGNAYWYFYGTRLYKEEPSSRAKKSKNWEEEWKQQKNSSVVQKRGRGRPKKCNPTELNGESEESEKFNQKNNQIFKLDSKSRWSVVCTTLNDWEMLAEKFKGSKYKCELSLYKIITRNFLPSLSGMYVEKEKRLKEKLMEYVNQRPSTRLESKKQQNSNASVLGNLDDSQMSENLPNKKIKTSQFQSRIRSLKEDAVRKEVFGNVKQDEVEVYSDEMKPFYESRLDKQLVDKVLSREPEMFMKLRSVMSKVKLHKDSWPFLNAVEEAIAPGYYDIVKDPIDLSAIERKIHLRAYHTLRQVEQDFQKMVFNCRLYNGAKSSYTDMAKALLQTFWNSLIEVTSQTTALEKKVHEEAVISPQYRKSKGNLRAKQNKQLPNRRAKRNLKFRKKKRVYLPTMQGLEMLAEASEQAVKPVSVIRGTSNAKVNSRKPKRKKRQEVIYTQLTTHLSSGTNSSTFSSGSQNVNEIQVTATPTAATVRSVQCQSTTLQNEVRSSNNNAGTSSSPLEGSSGKNASNFNMPISSTIQTEPKSSSIPIFTPYNLNSTADGKRLGVTESNNLWSVKDSRTIYSIPVTQSSAPHPLLASQPSNDTSICSTGFSMLYGDNRLQTVFPVPANVIPTSQGMEQNTVDNLSSPKTSTLPNISPGLFSNFPVLYTVPNTSPNTFYQTAVSSEMSCPKDTVGAKPGNYHPYLLQGVPSRPIQDVSNVAPQLRHPNYLNIPHYMVPPQQQLHTVLPAPLTPAYTIHGPGEPNESLLNVNSSPQGGNKTAPVYTILQNVPLRPRT